MLFITKKIGPERKSNLPEWVQLGQQTNKLPELHDDFTNSTVEAGAKVIDTVLMPGAVVEEGAVVTRALVADGVRIGRNAVVGSADSENILLVAKRVKGEE